MKFFIILFCIGIVCAINNSIEETNGLKTYKDERSSVKDKFKAFISELSGNIKSLQSILPAIAYADDESSDESPAFRGYDDSISISSVEDLFKQSIHEFLDKIESIRAKLSVPFRALLDEITIILFKLSHRISKVNFETDAALFALTTGSNDKAEEIIVDKSRILFDEISRVDVQLYEDFKRLDIDEEPILPERVLFVKGKIFYALYGRIIKILNKVLERRFFPQRIIQLAEKAYTKLENTIQSIVLNLCDRINAIKACRGQLSNLDISNLIKFDSIFVNAQEIRFEELANLVLKYINSESRIKSYITEILEKFKKQLETRLDLVSNRLKNNPGYPSKVVINMKMVKLFLKRTIPEVDKLKIKIIPSNLM